MPTQEQIWQTLQERVCVKCVDGDGLGNCRIAHNGFCAMKTFLPKILDVVNSVSSNSMLPYEEALRAKVCRDCKHQSPAGSCLLRDHVDCALDRYFPFIVEVIEETQTRARPVAASRKES